VVSAANQKIAACWSWFGGFLVGWREDPRVVGSHDDEWHRPYGRRGEGRHRRPLGLGLFFLLKLGALDEWSALLCEGIDQ